MGLLTLLPLLGIAFSFGRVARVPAANAFFLATSLVILALYVGALAGALWWTALAIHVGGIALLGREALRHARERAAIAVPVPMGVLALLCAWFWVVHGADQFILYDEYAHWGVFLKEMLALDGFWTADTNSIHPRYLPGAPLWQYLFNAFGLPSEGKAYFAHFILLTAPLLQLWRQVRWSESAWIGAILALVLLAIANFGVGVSTILVDPIIGVWFLGTLLAAFADDNLASRRVVLYAAPLAVIALLKDVGLALAASGAFILAALVCTRMLTPEHRRRALPKAATALAVLLAPMLLCVQVWSWNRDAVGAAHEVYSVSGVVSGIAEQIDTADSELKAEIGRRLTEVFFDQQISNSSVSWEHNEFTYAIRELFTDSYRLTTFGLMVVFVLWWVGIAYGVLAGDSRRQWLIVAGGVFVTAAVYLAALHLSYRFTFGARGLDLPSYVRYVNVIALPMVLLSFCPLLPAFRNLDANRAWSHRQWTVRRGTALFVAAVLALYVIETPYLRPIVQPNAELAVRDYIEDVVEPIRANAGTSPTWIYYPDRSPYRSFSRVMQYLLSPTPTVVEHSEAFLQSDAASIAAVWSGFEYVWIAVPLTPEAAAAFARFGAGEATAGLFRVHPSRGGGVALEPVGEQNHTDESAARRNPPL